MTVDGALAAKPARLVDPAQSVELLAPPPPYVSRAGLKLATALDTLALDPAGWCCVDAGSSTGGFTDCLLQRGAARVVAIDVGTHQLHERLRADPRVEVREQTDIRSVDPASLPQPPDLVVADLSFISLRLVLPALHALAGPSPILALVKPQFEAGRQEASRGRGVIRQPAIWERVLRDVVDCALTLGRVPFGALVSPVTGSRGNVEFVVGLRAASPSLDPVGAAGDQTEVDRMLTELVAEAEARVP